MTNYAPIVLFVYNRPEHTRITVEALQNNILADQSELIIISDAPKTSKQVEKVHEVRDFIHQIDGFKLVTIVERKTNFGLASSIIDAVSVIVSEHGRIIVLEDDLVTSKYFLNYMNAALDTYQNEEMVMHISGYMYPVNNESLPETFFLRTSSCWGWATWDRAWKHFNKDSKQLLREFTKQEIFRFNMDGVYNFWEQVKQNESGLINTWAIFWYASIFKWNGLCLHPAYSMVNNIGHDGSGENCSIMNDFSTVLAINPIRYFEKDIYESTLAHAKTKEFFVKVSPTFFTRVYMAIKRRLKISSLFEI